MKFKFPFSECYSEKVKYSFMYNDKIIYSLRYLVLQTKKGYGV